MARRDGSCCGTPRPWNFGDPLESLEVAETGLQTMTSPVLPTHRAPLPLSFPLALGSLRLPGRDGRHHHRAQLRPIGPTFGRTGCNAEPSHKLVEPLATGQFRPRSGRSESHFGGGGGLGGDSGVLLWSRRGRTTRSVGHTHKLPLLCFRDTLCFCFCVCVWVCLCRESDTLP